MGLSLGGESSTAGQDEDAGSTTAERQSTEGEGSTAAKSNELETPGAEE